MLKKAVFHRRLLCPFCTAKFPAPASLTRSRRYSKTSRRAAAIADDSPGPNRHFGERYKCTTQASKAYLFGPDCHSGTRIKAGPSFWIKESFSLADLYAADIEVHDLGVNGDPRLEGRASVWFHIRNLKRRSPIRKVVETIQFRQKITTYTTTTEFAPRFAKLSKGRLNHAARDHRVSEFPLPA